MPERRPRVLLADDHPLMLSGLCKLLEPVVEVVGTASDGPALLAAAESLRPDLVLTDIAMPGLDGIEATRRLQKTAPGVKVLVLSVHAEPSRVQAAFEAGAWGYLTKSSAPEEVELAVDEVLAGHFYLSPEAARAALGATASHLKGPSAAAGEVFTPRELDILRLVAVGLGNQQIAGRLGVGVTTVRTHLNRIYEKLGLKSRVELALYAAQQASPPA